MPRSFRLPLRLAALAVLWPLAALGAKPLPAARAKTELAINVPGVKRGSFYANPSNDAKLTTTRLFGKNGPRPNDVAQGELNNCFFDGTIGAIASVDRAALRKVFATTPDGRLRLDEQGRASITFSYKGRPETVKVSAALVYGGSNGRPRFTQVANQKLWAPLLEKGYAELLARNGRVKGLNALNQGGEPSDVIEAITGKKSVTSTVAPTSASMEQTWSALQAATKRKAIIVAGTISGKREFTTKLHAAVKEGVLPLEARSYTMGGQRVVDDHDQSVLGISTKNGERFVTIRNPWDSFVPRGAGRKHGVYTLPLSKFVTYFDELTYSK